MNMLKETDETLSKDMPTGIPWRFHVPMYPVGIISHF